MEPIVSHSPGKCIIFGEHAVVYGYTAVAASLKAGSHCEIRFTNKNHIIGHFPNYNTTIPWQHSEKSVPSEFSQFFAVLHKIKQDFNVEISNFEFKVISDLWVNAGLGSSASSSLAYLLGLMKLFEINLNVDQLNQLLFFMEKIVHGNPSGIDNSTVLYGGLIKFKGQKVSPLSLKSFPPVLIINSQEIHNTKHAISIVREQCQKNPQEIQKIFSQMQSICQEGIIALQNGDLREIGRLMNENHKLLTNLHLSTTKIEDIVSLASKMGIYGTKITGAGLGGALISVANIEELKNFQKVLTQKQIPSILTNLGVPSYIQS